MDHPSLIVTWEYLLRRTGFHSQNLFLSVHLRLDLYEKKMHLEVDQTRDQRKNEFYDRKAYAMEYNR